MNTQNNIRKVLKGHSLIPVVTFGEEDDPLKFVKYLQSQKINCIEITLRTPQGIESILYIKKIFGNDMLVGGGTVTNTNNISDLQKAKADFIVSPGSTPLLLEAMQTSGLPYLPGVATPSDVINAMEAGLDTLKFFPAELFGGIATLKSYAQLFPSVQFCPTGGINQQSSIDFLKLSNVIAVGGTWFQKNYQKLENSDIRP